VPINRLTVPPDALPDGADDAAELDVLAAAADDDDVLDDDPLLPHAPIASAATAASSAPAHGLTYLFTDPPPEVRVVPRPHNVLLKPGGCELGSSLESAA
jgi:hypothetical protein